jgi:hypothetical protein
LIQSEMDELMEAALEAGIIRKRIAYPVGSGASSRRGRQRA